MKHTIDFSTFGTSTRQRQINETAKYRDILIQEGMEELSVGEFLSILADLGYKVDNSSTFNYYNDYNEHSYLARSMSYIDIKSKQSYAHFEQRFTNHVNLDKLQRIRGNYFVYDKNRIWDL